MALEYHRRAHRAAQEGQVTDPDFQALVAADLAADYWALSDYSRANEVYREAVKRFEGKVSPTRMAPLYWGLSLTAFRLGDLQQARTYALRTLELYEAEAAHEDTARKAAGRHALAQARINYAVVLMALDSLDEAARQLHAAAESTEDLTTQATVHRHLSEIALSRGQAEEAAAEATTAMEAARRNKNTRLLGQAMEHAAHVAAASGDAAAALTHYQNAVAVLEATSHRSLLSEVLFDQARLLYQHGRAPEAMQAYEQAYRTAGTSAGAGHVHLTPPPDQPGYTRQPATSRERRQVRTQRASPITRSGSGPVSGGSGAAPAAGRRPRKVTTEASTPAELPTPARRGRRPRTPAVEA
jgi:tetratricopeptide (TPR) repeat protein